MTTTDTALPAYVTAYRGKVPEGWEYYAARMLKTPPIGEQEHPKEPQCGYWRIPASKSNPSGNVNVRAPKSWPISIWRGKDGFLRIRFGKRDETAENVDVKGHTDFLNDSWHRVVPVSEEAYDEAMASGGSWPDEHPAVTASNNAPPDDTLEALSERIADLTREAQKLVEAGAAKSQDESDRAADLSNLLGQLEARADKLREEEKAPAWQACKDIEAKWRGPISDAKTWKKALKDSVCLPFQKAAQEKLDAERAARTQAGTPPAEWEPKTVTSGSRGRPVSLRTVKVAVIDNPDLVYGFFRENAKVKELLQALATDAVRKGIAVPGTTVATDKVAA